MVLWVGLPSEQLFRERSFIDFPKTTAIGSLSHYISNYEGSNFQPMNVNLASWIHGHKKCARKEKNALIANRALEELDALKAKENI